MKRVAKVLVIVIAVAALLAFAACEGIDKRQDFVKEPFFKSQNVLEGAVVTNENVRNGDETSAQNMLDNIGDGWTPRDINRNPAAEDEYHNISPYAEIKLKAVSTFNTAYINEIGSEVLYFRLQTWNEREKKWDNFYQSEKIEDMRVCSFDAVTTDRIKFCVDKLRSADVRAKIKSLKLFNETGRTRDDFTVAVYQRLDGDKPTETLEKIKEARAANDVSSPYYDYPAYYDVYNTVIIFDAINWTGNGDVLYMSKTAEDSDESRFEREMSALKEIISMRTDKSNEVDLIIGAVADGSSAGSGGINSLMADETRLDKVVDNIIKLMKKHGFNGADIDWEYPWSEEDWAHYDDFITKLDTRMIAEIGKNKVLSAALSAWSLGMSRDVLARFDQIQFMAYDSGDIDGFQSGLRHAQYGLADFIMNGVDPKKINIGIAAYGRPGRSEPYWGTWRDLQADPALIYWNNKYYNVTIDGELMDAYYVSPALAGDKLAYALLADVGGVMVFRLACDKFPKDPNSLVNGMKNALERYD